MKTQNQSIGSRIKKARKNNNIRFCDFAKALGFSSSVLARIEAGLAPTPFDVLLFSSTTLNTNPDYIARGDFYYRIKPLLSKLTGEQDDALNPYDYSPTYCITKHFKKKQ